MVKRKSLLVSFLCIILLFAVFMFIRFHKSAPERIKHNLAILSSIVSKASGGKRCSFLEKIEKARNLLDTSCQIIVEEERISGVYNPQQIAALAERFQGQVAESHLSFYDLKIYLPEKHEAIIHCTARLKGTTRSNERFDEFRELKIEARQLKGKWLFTRFQEVEALEK